MGNVVFADFDRRIRPSHKDSSDCHGTSGTLVHFTPNSQVGLNELTDTHVTFRPLKNLCSEKNPHKTLRNTHILWSILDFVRIYPGNTTMKEVERICEMPFSETCTLAEDQLKRGEEKFHQILMNAWFHLTLPAERHFAQRCCVAIVEAAHLHSRRLYSVHP